MTATDDRPATGRAGTAPGPERPRRRGPWIGLAALTALLVTVPTGLEVAGVQMRHSSDITETFASRTPKKVEVDATSASVTVRASASGPARVRKDLHWMLSKPRVETEWDGDTLKLKVYCGEGGLLAMSLCEADVTLTVPRGVSVDGRMTSGTLAVEGVTGGVDLADNSGTLELDGVSGPVRARVSSGSVRGERLDSAQVEAASGSGSIELGFATAPTKVSARTGSGSVDVAVPAGTKYLVTGNTGSGARDVPAGIRTTSPERLLDLTSNSGSVKVHY